MNARTGRRPLNITVPGEPWFAARLADYVGPDPLSDEARTMLGLALNFPQFQAPGREELMCLHRDALARSGSRYRPYGAVRVKEALKELKTKGFYGIRRASLGRLARMADDGRPRLAYARSYGNEPAKHLTLLEALDDEDIRRHDQAGRGIWARYLMTGRLAAGEATVINLEERRLSRAG